MDSFFSMCILDKCIKIFSSAEFSISVTVYLLKHRRTSCGFLKATQDSSRAKPKTDCDHSLPKSSKNNHLLFFFSYCFSLFL